MLMCSCPSTSPLQPNAPLFLSFKFLSVPLATTPFPAAGFPLEIDPHDTLLCLRKAFVCSLTLQTSGEHCSAFYFYRRCYHPVIRL